MIEQENVCMRETQSVRKSMQAHDCGYLCVFANHSPGWGYCSPFTKTTTSSAGKARCINGQALLLNRVPCAHAPLWFVFACSEETALARLTVGMSARAEGPKLM